MNISLRSAIYCRSAPTAHGSADPTALLAQEATCRAHAASHGWDVVGVYRDDGWSGHDLDRPGLVALHKDARRGAFATVLVLDQERIAHSGLLACTFIVQLARCGVTLLTARGPADPVLARLALTLADPGVQHANRTALAHRRRTR